MLDLAFVRDHLAFVEKKLRQRGMNPDEVLKDFHATRRPSGARRSQQLESPEGAAQPSCGRDRAA